MLKILLIACIDGNYSDDNYDDDNYDDANYDDDNYDDDNYDDDNCDDDNYDDGNYDDDNYDYGDNYFETTVKEALHIKLQKPMLNKQLFSHGSSFVLNSF